MQVDFKQDKAKFGHFYKVVNINNKGEMVSLYDSTCCRKKVFEVGKVYRVNGVPSIAENGYHFCSRLLDLQDLSYHLIRPTVAVMVIEVLGDLISDRRMKAFCSNKIKVLGVLSVDEIYDLLDKERYSL